MTAGELEAMAERLMLGEYTTADLHAAARCARAWAGFDKMVRAQEGYSLDVWLTRKGGIRIVTNDRSLNGPTALETVEAAEVGK